MTRRPIEPVHRYGAVAMSLHWLVVILVIAAWLLGEFGDVLPKGSARATGLVVHMSLGLTILLAVIARVAWRRQNPPPPTQPTALSPWSDHAATLVHWLLYLLMFVVPIAGISVQFTRGHAVPLYGLVEIASPFAADQTLSRTVLGIHQFLADGLVILAAFHAAAAFIHHWFFKDHTLRRMLPGR
jgi:cytochrome b561